MHILLISAFCLSLRSFFVCLFDQLSLPLNSNNRKSWGNYYSNNRQTKNKPELNGNYCSSSSSTTSSSNEKLASNKVRKDGSDTTTNTTKTNCTEKKSISTKSQPADSTSLCLKALSLSDSEASDVKVKAAPSDYFHWPRTKAASCSSSISSPVMSASPPSCNSISTSSINSQTDANTFLMSIDKDASTSSKAPSQDSYFMHNKSDKSLYDRSAASNFSQSGRRNVSLSSGYISTGSSMLSDEMHTSSGNNHRYRLTHQNVMYREQTYYNVMPSENYSDSPIRTKQYLTNSNMQYSKRR